MDEDEQKKMEQIPIVITIDGLEFKTTALDIFFLYRCVTIYSEHTRLKNFLKKAMDKQLVKIGVEPAKETIKRIEKEVRERLEK